MANTQQTTLPLHTTRGKQSPDPGSTQQNNSKVDGASVPQTTTTTTTTWTPNLARRQSWNAQDRKHELQKAAVDAVQTGPGFTERST